MYRLDKNLKPTTAEDELGFQGEYLVTKANHKRLARYAASHKKQLRVIFDMLDVDSDGYISRTDLYEGLPQFTADGCRYSTEFTDLLSSITGHDIDGDGVISFEEFVVSQTRPGMRGFSLTGFADAAREEKRVAQG